MFIMKSDFLDLKKRCIKFVGQVVTLMTTVKEKSLRFSLENQIIRSASSVGANYVEGNGGVTKKDWLNYMNIARKSAMETVYWLEVIKECSKDYDQTFFNDVYEESLQLLKIFTSITKTGQSRYGRNNKH